MRMTSTSASHRVVQDLSVTAIGKKVQLSTNVYQARLLKSIPAPVALDDSDDEFNPQSEINQVTKAPKKRRSGQPRRKTGSIRQKYRDTVPVELAQFLGTIDSSDDDECNTTNGRAASGAKNVAGESATDNGDSDNSDPQSVTEDESEHESSSIGNKRKAEPIARPGKRCKLDAGLKSTGQEADDDDDPLIRPRFSPTLKQAKSGALVLSGNFIVPVHVNRFLRPYQRQGAEFFAKRYSEGRGGILADDMGLGKTIQVISFLAALMQKHNDRRDIGRRADFVLRRQQRGAGARAGKVDVQAITRWPTCLIVAPATLVGNWERELHTWGHFEFDTYLGAHRHDILRKFQLGKLDILLTSVDTMKNDITLLQDLPFKCIFVDECHNAKNPKSRMYEALHSFSCRVRFGMTGTAVQNSYEELWCILDIAIPGQFGTLADWKRCIAEPLRLGQAHDADRKARNTSRGVRRALERLLAAHFLRREKHDPKIALALPQKTDHIVFCPLLEPQRHVYQQILDTPEVRRMVRKDEICKCDENKVKNKPKKRSQCCYPFHPADMLRYMDVILKVSNHPILIMPSPKMSPEKFNRAKFICDIVWPDGDRPSYADVAFSPAFCGKWKVLLTLLRSWRKDKDAKNKVLIFTRSVQLLDFIEFNLQSSDINFVRLDGSTKQSDRMGIVDQFNLDPDVFAFLISTLAGGTGLNLTSANKVVIFDPNWNPAHDMQAMDRAYRFGQQRDVEVYRLLSDGTLEENIYQRQVYKGHQSEIAYKGAEPKRLWDGVQFSKDREGELFGIKNIFTLKQKTDSTTTTHRIQRAELKSLEWALGNVDAAAEDDHALADFVLASPKELLQLDTPTILKKAGVVTIRHEDMMRNDDLERVEERARRSAEREKVEKKQLEKVRRQRMREVTGDEPDEESEEEEEMSTSAKRRDIVEENWPPRRRKHKEPAHPRRQSGAYKLEARKEALVQKGYIQNLEDYADYAKVFARHTAEEQRRIVLSLDLDA